MTDNVVYLNNITSLDIPADRVLDNALDDQLSDAVVIGYKDGDYYFASSIANGAEVVWLLEMCKKRLLDIADV